MSHYHEAQPSFPWIPLLLLVAGSGLVVLMLRWVLQYLKYVWFNVVPARRHKKHRKKSKRGRSKRKKAKYSDSDEDSEDSSSYSSSSE